MCNDRFCPTEASSIPVDSEGVVCLGSCRVFSVCLLVVGSVLVATIFGNMTVLLSNYDAQSRAYQEKLERVKQGLARMEVPALLQGRVIKYYEYMWRRQKSGANESNFVLELPRALRVDVQLHLHRQLVEKVPFFQGSERAFIQDIVEALASSIYVRPSANHNNAPNACSNVADSRMHHSRMLHVRIGCVVLSVPSAPARPRARGTTSSSRVTVGSACSSLRPARSRSVRMAVPQPAVEWR